MTLPGNTPTTVATLSLPQGKFMIGAKTYVATSVANGATVGCDLRAGNDADISYAWVNTAVVHETLALNAVHEYSNPGAADLVCTSTVAATANRSRITAIKVATLTASG